MPNTTNPTGSDMWPDTRNHANDPSEIGNTRHMQQLAQNYTPNYDPMRADRPLSYPHVDELREQIEPLLLSWDTIYGTELDTNQKHALLYEVIPNIIALITTKRAEWLIKELESFTGCPPILFEKTLVERIKELKEGK